MPIADPAAAAVDVTAHLSWAAAVARGVARAYRLRGQEAADLEQTAHLTLVRCALAFDAGRVPEAGDAGGAFRGYCHREVQSECRREAARLRNGGTFKTRRRGQGVLLAIPTSDFARAGGFDVPGREAGEGEAVTSSDDPPPVLMGTRRRVVSKPG